MNMNNIDLWQWVVAFLTPYVVSLVNRPTWSRTTKRLVMIGVSIVVALITEFLEGNFNDFSWAQLTVFLAAFVGVVQAAYAAFEAAGPTNWLLDQTEMMLTKITVPQALQAKKQVNTAAESEFKENVAA
jgi:dsRNA-specific ribonuclease